VRYNLINLQLLLQLPSKEWLRLQLQNTRSYFMFYFERKANLTLRKGQSGLTSLKTKLGFHGPCLILGYLSTSEIIQNAS
jgi:hypothetical protein